MADNYPMDLPLALGRRWRVAHNSTGSTTTNKAFERRGSWAGSMRQQEHLDEATAACWVTFCSEAIRTKVLIVAQHAALPRIRILSDRRARRLRSIVGYE